MPILGSQTSYDYNIVDNDNAAPIVNAGPDQTVVLPGDARLDSTTTDDGMPNPPAGLTVAWTKVSGPGTVTFADPTRPTRRPVSAPPAPTSCRSRPTTACCRPPTRSR